MTICDKCRKQSGTICVYGFGKIGEYLNLKNKFELCEPCYHKVVQKIKEFVNDKNV